MNIESILSPARTRCGLVASSKKRAIEEAANLIAAGMKELDAADIYEGLMGREKLGTTAIGHGIAIPHCRVDHCSGIVGSLVRLQAPIDFGAFDDEPVSLLFVLLVPVKEVDEHLQTLAMLARRFDSASYRQRLLQANDDDALYRLAIEEIGNN